MMRASRFALLFAATVLYAEPASAQILDSLEAEDRFGWALAVGDFNGDGADDLALGAPQETLGDLINAGMVHVLYGTPGGGLSDAGNQRWSQDTPGVDGEASASEQFGHALAVGDFNGDGFDDLAIDVPYQDLGTAERAGAVHVLYGSAVGLSADGSQLWDQGAVTGEPMNAEALDFFGWALTAGDFDGDGFDDLAIGVPFENHALGEDIGYVHVLYGTDEGLSPDRTQLWAQFSDGLSSNAEPGDLFGWALAAGDFNADGRDDLAVGSPFEDFGAGPPDDVGFVHVLYGTDEGLTGAGSDAWTQDEPGIGGVEEEDDWFGRALAAGDFDGDGRDDLAIGVPGEDEAVGLVHVLRGTDDGLTSEGTQDWHQDTPGVEGEVEPDDRFGFALAAGDFDGDGHDDLAIGAAEEDLGTITDAGGTHVLYGTPGTGLVADGSQFWTQGAGGVEGEAEAFDGFGWALAAGDFDGDGAADLAIGAPFDDLDGLSSAGTGHVLYGTTPDGLTANRSQFLFQGADLPLPVAAEPAPGPTEAVALAAYPNPFVEHATAAFELAEAGPVRLTLYSVLGRRVALLLDAHRAAGGHTVDFDAGALPAGVYLLRLEAEGGTHALPLVRTR